MLKLSKENKKFIKLILDGFFRIYLRALFCKFKPKKYKAHSRYAVVSAVYNTEAYLKDYFKTLINQRLDFKTNMVLICVDDQSTDKSASIIKKYQKKYPKNIIYLHKKNAGASSARNLGLKYLKENDLNVSWVSFIDPDDFVDRNYFYEVDKYIKKYKDKLCMVSCNMIFYFEKFKTYRDNHPLNYKYKNSYTLLQNENLNHFIQLSAASVVLKFDLVKGLFDENLKPNFEDGKFINEYLLQNLDKQSIFLKNARYFYRKRKNQNSTIDTKYTNKSYYTAVPKAYLSLLKNSKNLAFIQNVVLYDLYWCVKDLLDTKISILNNTEKANFKEILLEIFAYIDECVIKNFQKNFLDCSIFDGMLKYFKNISFKVCKAYIEQLDDKNDEILVKYYFVDKSQETKLFLDKLKINAKHSKIRQYDFLDSVFLYEKRMWLEIKNSKMLEVYVNSNKLKLSFNETLQEDLSDILKALKKQKKQRARNLNLWLFADMSYRADDNAEHLYRYVMKNSKQKIAFVLRKNCKDYERLKKEGFNLVDPKSLKFKYLLYRADKIISSHIDKYIFNAFGGDTLKTKDFIFLQHGITKDDVSKWFNKRKIDVFITGFKAEYDSLSLDFNHYKFSSKEVKLTGFPRWDALVKNNRSNTKQILIMPTWRQYLSGKIQKYGLRAKNPDFTSSLYFQKWQEFLSSKELENLVKEYDYKVVFMPHPQVRMYLQDFCLPLYIQTSYEASIQELFCSSSLMITDYSSVAFEMAVLNKPVLYYQFDKDEFFAKHIYSQGYFDYEKHGFGEVCFDVTSLLAVLSSYLNGYQAKDNKLVQGLNSCEKVLKEILYL